MSYQFQIDNRAAAPVRETKRDALEDAVDAGYALRLSDGNYRLDSNQGAAVVLIEDNRS